MGKGRDLNMLIGGNIPFNSDDLSPITLRFVLFPTFIHPTTALTYNATMFKFDGKPIFNHNYLDSDGILDLDRTNEDKCYLINI